LFLLIFLFSCSDRKPISTTKNTKTTSLKEEVVIDFTCENKQTGFEQSELDLRIKNLGSLENKYKQTKKGKFTVKESNLISGIERFVKGKNRTDKSIEYTINADYESIISEMNFSLIKGEKNLNENLYARARIEEYIFYSKECASNFAQNLNQIVENDNQWYEINKSPNSIYQSNNKIYFIVSGGWYMKPFYEEIVNSFKAKSEESIYCSFSELSFVLNRIENHPNEISEKDAFILIANNCKNQIEYAQLQNELIFKILSLKPEVFVNTIESKNVNQVALDYFYKRVMSPINDDMDLNQILNEISKLNQNETTQNVVKSLRIAIRKYN